jgi:cytochrome c biogenesis protein CcmG, thiol:disulfide interchange protein DsbE
MLREILGKNLRFKACAVIGLLAVAPKLQADETLPVLKVGSEVYSNVTVTSVSATDVYFSFAGGMGNAKLKNLDAALQKHFHFDAAKAGEIEKSQHVANAQLRAELLNKKPARPPAQPTEMVPPPTTDDGGDIVVPKLYARSFRGQRPPQIVVDQWLTPQPDVNGKFVLVDFWATWCGPCRLSIPHLNELQAKFKDRLVVIGLSDESPDDLRKMTSPQLNYFVGTDTQARTMKAVEVTGIPHAILIDPKGIVRFEGMPVYLDEKGLEHLLDKYSN